MMFIQYVAGDRCWHMPGYYGNLTIDDPSLVEPYGHLSYTDILSEMKRSNFHTTIGFIPWNYDQNSLDVIDIFKTNLDSCEIEIENDLGKIHIITLNSWCQHFIPLKKVLL